MVEDPLRKYGRLRNWEWWQPKPRRPRQYDEPGGYGRAEGKAAAAGYSSAEEWAAAGWPHPQDPETGSPYEGYKIDRMERGRHPDGRKMADEDWFDIRTQNIFDYLRGAQVHSSHYEWADEMRAKYPNYPMPGINMDELLRLMFPDWYDGEEEPAAPPVPREVPLPTRETFERMIPAAARDWMVRLGMDVSGIGVEEPGGVRRPPEDRALPMYERTEGEREEQRRAIRGREIAKRAIGPDWAGYVERAERKPTTWEEYLGAEEGEVAPPPEARPPREGMAELIERAKVLVREVAVARPLIRPEVVAAAEESVLVNLPTMWEIVAQVRSELIKGSFPSLAMIEKARPGTIEQVIATSLLPAEWAEIGLSQVYLQRLHIVKAGEVPEEWKGNVEAEAGYELGHLLGDLDEKTRGMMIGWIARIGWSPFQHQLAAAKRILDPKEYEGWALYEGELVEIKPGVPLKEGYAPVDMYDPGVVTQILRREEHPLAEMLGRTIVDPLNIFYISAVREAPGAFWRRLIGRRKPLKGIARAEQVFAAYGGIPEEAVEFLQSHHKKPPWYQEGRLNTVLDWFQDLPSRYAAWKAAGAPPVIMGLPEQAGDLTSYMRAAAKAEDEIARSYALVYPRLGTSDPNFLQVAAKAMSGGLNPAQLREMRVLVIEAENYRAMGNMEGAAEKVVALEKIAKEGLPLRERWKLLYRLSRTKAGSMNLVRPTPTASREIMADDAIRALGWMFENMPSGIDRAVAALLLKKDPQQLVKEFPWINSKAGLEAFRILQHIRDESLGSLAFATGIPSTNTQAGWTQLHEAFRRIAGTYHYPSPRPDLWQRMIGQFYRIAPRTFLSTGRYPLQNIVSNFTNIWLRYGWVTPRTDASSLAWINRFMGDAGFLPPGFARSITAAGEVSTERIPTLLGRKWVYEGPTTRGRESPSEEALAAAREVSRGPSPVAWAKRLVKKGAQFLPFGEGWIDLSKWGERNASMANYRDVVETIKGEFGRPGRGFLPTVPEGVEASLEMREAIEEIVASSWNWGEIIEGVARLYGVETLPKQAHYLSTERIRNLGAEAIEVADDLMEALTMAGDSRTAFQRRYRLIKKGVGKHVGEWIAAEPDFPEEVILPRAPLEGLTPEQAQRLMALTGTAERNRGHIRNARRILIELARKNTELPIQQRYDMADVVIDKAYRDYFLAGREGSRMTDSFWATINDGRLWPMQRDKIVKMHATAHENIDKAIHNAAIRLGGDSATLREELELFPWGGLPEDMADRKMRALQDDIISSAYEMQAWGLPLAPEGVITPPTDSVRAIKDWAKEQPLAANAWLEYMREAIEDKALAEAVEVVSRTPAEEIKRARRASWREGTAREIELMEEKIARLQNEIATSPVAAADIEQLTTRQQELYGMAMELEGLKDTLTSLPTQKDVFRFWDYKEGAFRKVKDPSGRVVDFAKSEIVQEIAYKHYGLEHGLQGAEQFGEMIRQRLDLSNRVATLENLIWEEPELILPETAEELETFIKQSEPQLEQMMLYEREPHLFQTGLRHYEEAVDRLAKIRSGEAMPESVVSKVENAKAEIAKLEREREAIRLATLQRNRIPASAEERVMLAQDLQALNEQYVAKGIVKRNRLGQGNLFDDLEELRERGFFERVVRGARKADKARAIPKIGYRHYFYTLTDEGRQAVKGISIVRQLEEVPKPVPPGSRVEPEIPRGEPITAEEREAIQEEMTIEQGRKWMRSLGYPQAVIDKLKEDQIWEMIAIAERRAPPPTGVPGVEAGPPITAAEQAALFGAPEEVGIPRPEVPKPQLPGLEAGEFFGGGEIPMEIPPEARERLPELPMEIEGLTPEAAEKAAMEEGAYRLPGVEPVVDGVPIRVGTTKAGEPVEPNEAAMEILREALRDPDIVRLARLLEIEEIVINHIRVPPKYVGKPPMAAYTPLTREIMISPILDKLIEGQKLRGEPTRDPVEMILHELSHDIVAKGRMSQETTLEWDKWLEEEANQKILGEALGGDWWITAQISFGPFPIFWDALAESLVKYIKEPTALPEFVQSFFDKHLPEVLGEPWRAPEAVAPEVVLPEGWSMETGKPRTKEGVTARAEIDFEGKRIVFADEAAMEDPKIVQHEIAHLRLHELDDSAREALIADYIKVADITEAEVEQRVFNEWLPMDYGEYLVDPSKVKPEVAAVFEKHFPTAVAPEARTADVILDAINATHARIQARRGTGQEVELAAAQADLARLAEEFKAAGGMEAVTAEAPFKVGQEVIVTNGKLIPAHINLSEGDKVTVTSVRTEGEAIGYISVDKKYVDGFFEPKAFGPVTEPIEPRVAPEVPEVVSPEVAALTAEYQILDVLQSLNQSGARLGFSQRKPGGPMRLSGTDPAGNAIDAKGSPEEILATLRKIAPVAPKPVYVERVKNLEEYISKAEEQIATGKLSEAERLTREGNIRDFLQELRDEIGYGHISPEDISADIYHRLIEAPPLRPELPKPAEVLREKGVLPAYEEPAPPVVDMDEVARTKETALGWLHKGREHGDMRMLQTADNLYMTALEEEFSIPPAPEPPPEFEIPSEVPKSRRREFKNLVRAKYELSFLYPRVEALLELERTMSEAQRMTPVGRGADPVWEDLLAHVAEEFREEIQPYAFLPDHLQPLSYMRTLLFDVDWRIDTAEKTVADIIEGLPKKWKKLGKSILPTLADLAKPPEAPAGIPTMITRAQREALGELGYSEAMINQMTPEQGLGLIQGRLKDFAPTFETPGGPMGDLEGVMPPSPREGAELKQDLLIERMDEWYKDVLKVFGEKIESDPTNFGNVNRWLEEELRGHWGHLKIYSDKMGEATTAWTLYNYRKLNIDTLMYRAFWWPYWQTRTGHRWLTTFLQNPAKLALWARWHDTHRKINDDLPENYRDTVHIPDMVPVIGGQYWNPYFFFDPIYAWMWSLDNFVPTWKRDGLLSAMVTATPISPLLGMREWLQPMITEEGRRLEPVTPWSRALYEKTGINIEAAAVKGAETLYGEVKPSIYSAMEKGGRRIGRPGLAERVLGGPGVQPIITEGRYRPTYIVRVLLDMWLAEEITEDEFNKAMSTREGEIWDQAIEEVKRERGLTEFSSIYTGIRARRLHPSEYEIEEFKRQRAIIGTMEEGPEKREYREQFYDNFPWGRQYDVRYDSAESAKQEATISEAWMDIENEAVISDKKLADAIRSRPGDLAYEYEVKQENREREETRRAFWRRQGVSFVFNPRTRTYEEIEDWVKGRLLSQFYYHLPQADKFTDEEGAIDWDTYNEAVEAFWEALPDEIVNWGDVQQMDLEIRDAVGKEVFVLKLAKEVATEEAYDVWRKANDLPEEALTQTWKKYIIDVANEYYQDELKDLEYDERNMPAFFAEFGQKPAEELIPYILQEYPDRWTEEELTETLAGIRMPGIWERWNQDGDERSTAISLLWAFWGGQTKLGRRRMKELLNSPIYNQYFVDKEGRNYERITNEELEGWLKELKVPNPWDDNDGALRTLYYWTVDSTGDPLLYKDEEPEARGGLPRMAAPPSEPPEPGEPTLGGLEQPGGRPLPWSYYQRVGRMVDAPENFWNWITRGYPIKDSWRERVETARPLVDLKTEVGGYAGGGDIVSRRPFRAGATYVFKHELGHYMDHYHMSSISQQPEWQEALKRWRDDPKWKESGERTWKYITLGHPQGSEEKPSWLEGYAYVATYPFSDVPPYIRKFYPWRDWAEEEDTEKRKQVQLIAQGNVTREAAVYGQEPRGGLPEDEAARMWEDYQNPEYPIAGLVFAWAHDKAGSLEETRVAWKNIPEEQRYAALEWFFDELWPNAQSYPERFGTELKFWQNVKGFLDFIGVVDVRQKEMQRGRPPGLAAAMPIEPGARPSMSPEAPPPVPGETPPIPEEEEVRPEPLRTIPQLAGTSESAEYARAQDEMSAWVAAGKEGDWTPLMEKWFGKDTPAGFFWEYYWAEIPPGRIADDVRKDPIIEMLLSKAFRTVYEVKGGVYEAALETLQGWREAHPELPGDPKEWAIVRQIVKKYWELREAGAQNEARAIWMFFTALLEPYYPSTYVPKKKDGPGPGAARRAAARAYGRGGRKGGPFLTRWRRWANIRYYPPRGGR